MSIWIGTSGWSYNNWKDRFYPKKTKPSERLSYYAQQFNSVEINSSFYVPPKPETLRSWCKFTPDKFLFSVKAWNLITHKRKLKDCVDNLNFFLGRIKTLANKCGPILFQLPFNFTKNLDRLKAFVRILPGNYRYVFEFRHPSWWCEEVYSILKRNRIAFCIFELADSLSPKIVTADFIYIRLHGKEGFYKGKYSGSELLKWKNWIKAQRKKTYVYFDNTARKDDAIQNAIQLSEMFKR